MIKIDMEMPSGCRYCRFYNEDLHFYAMCAALYPNIEKVHNIEAAIAENFERRDDCPLIPCDEEEKRICPSCGKEYTDAPAVSRKDGSDICPECGEEEALDDWFWANYRKEIE